MKVISSWYAKLAAALGILVGVAVSIGLYGEDATKSLAPTQGEQRERNPFAGIRPEPGEPLRPGWSRPAPEKMPVPTYWPMVFGLGVAFFMWGLISNLFVLGLGFTLLVAGAVGWIVDLLGEFKD